MLIKCEVCIHKKKCIDGANIKHAKQCTRYKEKVPALRQQEQAQKTLNHVNNNTKKK